ncbi:hypothetical protein [Sediminibacter sp. Hel_I_10]|uniref:hypothetical protein n=1 Tax=Sediminibacter sp. Hel_I_10 TaxID=1392490 RepID=UPI00047A5FAD|nr:hypothetical protein [Sediminibacter sp. Hel_I_10]
MNSRTKKIALILGGIVVLIIAVFFIADDVANRKFEAMVEKLPSHIKLQYDDFDLNILGGNLTLVNPVLTIKGETTGEVNARVELKTVAVEDLSYWTYLVHDTIAIESIRFVSPKMTYYHNDQISESSYNTSAQKQFKKAIQVQNFEISEADIEVFQYGTDSLIFKTEALNLSLDQLKVNSKTMASKVPMDFKALSIQTKNLKYRVNPYDDLSVGAIAITKEHSTFSNLKLQTTYSKEKLSTLIDKERDHFDLVMPSIEFQGQDVGFHQDSVFDFRSKKIILDQPKLEVYRDKLLADEMSQKALYSKMLRNLKFNLDIQEISINKGTIVYEEKVKPGNSAGQLDFKQLDATITNLGNTYGEGELTKIDINTTFMKSTPLEIDWNFDVNDVNDRFTFKARLGMLHAEDLNAFMKPNLNIKLEGELIKTYFTIDGNNNKSHVDLKTDYDEFDIVILQKDGREKNKLLSGLVNLLVAKSSDQKDSDYRYGSSSDIERNKTKSIFNYVWINAKSGLQSAMTGSGKKKD